MSIQTEALQRVAKSEQLEFSDVTGRTEGVWWINRNSNAAHSDRHCKWIETVNDVQLSEVVIPLDNRWFKLCRECFGHEAHRDSFFAKNVGPLHTKPVEK